MYTKRFKLPNALLCILIDIKMLNKSENVNIIRYMRVSNCVLLYTNTSYITVLEY